MMKQKKVKFASADEAKEFVSIASGCDFDVNVFYNRMIIDAKSLLGVLSLDLQRSSPLSSTARTHCSRSSSRERIRCTR